jgi:hypothetical protein
MGIAMANLIHLQDQRTTRVDAEVHVYEWVIEEGFGSQVRCSAGSKCSVASSHDLRRQLSYR